MQQISVTRIQVGMWVSMEPVAGTGFLLRSEQQIAVFAQLGVASVWYEPEKSEAEPLPEEIAIEPSAVLPKEVEPEKPVPPLSLVTPNAEIAEHRLDVSTFEASASDSSPIGASPIEMSHVEPPAQESPVDGQPVVDHQTDAASSTPKVASADTSALGAGSAFDEEPATVDPEGALDAQRQSLDRCERRFSAVSKAFRQVLVNVRAQPEEARVLAQAEIGGMVRAVRNEQDVAIRLLSEKSGQETALHAINVSVLSVLLGRAMGLDDETLNLIGLGALLHDVGKIELPDVVRTKAESSNPAERRMFQSHVEHSRSLAQRMGLPEAAAAIVAQHHESADGSGYPSGLKGEAIHPAARVVALVNHYDNLCNPPNPIHALTPHDAIAAVYRKTKEKFDAAALAAFVRMMGIYPPGSVLQLSDGRFALSVAVDPANSLKPKVLIYNAAVPVDEALLVALADEPELGIQRAIKPMQLPRVAFDYLQPRKRTSFFIESRVRRNS
jgi:putative nucleotidyltransferase with HDIG domain